MEDLSHIKVAILAANGFEQVELVEPRKALDEAGAKTYIVSLEDKVQGFHHDEKGDFFKVDVLLQDADANDYDALLLPGGLLNPDQLRMTPDAIQFVKAFNQKNKPIAAICHGPWLLINADIANGKRLTSWPSIAIDLVNAGAHWVDEPVVRDKNIVTSRKPADIPEFNKAMIQLFKS